MSKLQDFQTLPISRLLQDNDPSIPFKHFAFKIPSFQRGYRWEKKQVLELLEDLSKFVKSDDKEYFLQPIVVRRINEANNEWEVLDGQQRLTTLLLVLKELTKYQNPIYVEDYTLYSIEYVQRVNPNFDSPDPSASLDSFYISKAKQTIGTWFKEKKKDRQLIDKLIGSLFYLNYDHMVNFIWYVVQNDFTQNAVDDLYAIKVFNRLNKGKISLTSSELIKALYVIRCEENDKKTGSSNSADIFCEEWNRLERKFQDNDFWYFISNKQEEIQTRMDLLFDFVSFNNYDSDNYDSMESYRYFQKSFDGISDKTPDVLWKESKKAFDTFVHWYEDIELRNLIGYLIWTGMTPLQLYELIKNEKANRVGKDVLEWDDSLTRQVLVNRISNTIDGGRNLTEWDYHNKQQYDYIKNTLLLYNIEYCNKYHSAFQFYDFKKEGWDLEHVDSQKDNNIQATEDKIEWLEYVNQIHAFDPNAKMLLEEGRNLLSKIREEGKDSKNGFSDFYTEVYDYYNTNRPAEEQDKHTIDNLALLNCGINRSYQNAPFPYKRYSIITADKKGMFIPICTKNLFLKYYSGTAQLPSQLDFIRWGETDRKSYMADLQATIQKYLQS